MNTYTISYKQFGNFDLSTCEFDVEEGEMEVQAGSEREATAKAQETIGLYVMECVQK